MKSNQRNRSLESSLVFGQCADFLCPPESQIREWFPTLLQGRLRAAALDPYGILKYKSKVELNDTRVDSRIYTCQIDECHAKIILRKVAPDPEGNEYGLYGCFAHQHELPRQKRSEIIFTNQKEAQKFFDQHFKKMYTKVNNNIYHCRRTQLTEGFGLNSCQSKISILQSFKGYQSAPKEERPYSLCGFFYHSHQDDQKYHRTEHGGWICHNEDPDKPKSKAKQFPRVRNGKIFPLSARMAGITMEDILAAKKQRKKNIQEERRKRKVFSKENKK